jgi:hypothetical protein
MRSELLSRLFFHHGIYCSTHPLLILGLNFVLIVTFARGPLLEAYSHITDVSYEPTQFWDSPARRAPMEEELFIERFGLKPFLRLEQIVINTSSSCSPTQSGSGPGVLCKSTFLDVLCFQERLSRVKVEYYDKRYYPPLTGDAGTGNAGFVPGEAPSESVFGTDGREEDAETRRNPIKNFTLSDICYKPFADGKCLIHSPLEYWNSSREQLLSDPNVLATLSDSSILSSFGTPIPLHSVLGGVSMSFSSSPNSRSVNYSNTRNANNNNMISGAASILLTYFLEETRSSDGDASSKWTAEVWDRLWNAAILSQDRRSEGDDAVSSNTNNNLDLYEYAWRSDGEVKHLYYLLNEADAFISAELVILIVSYIITFVYISLVLGRVELVKSKFGLGFAAVLMVFSSLLMSVGLASMMGVRPSLVPW